MYYNFEFLTIFFVTLDRNIQINDESLVCYLSFWVHIEKLNNYRKLEEKTDPDR
jgi:hypothetical protein